MKTSLNKLFSKIITGEWGDDDPEGNGVNVIRTTNFRSNGKIDFTNLERRLIQKKVITGENKGSYIVDTEKIKQKSLQDGDIIIEKSGGGVGTPVGRVVYFENPNNEIYLSNNFTQTLRVDIGQAYPKYIFYYLKYLYNKGSILKYQNQTTGLFNLKLDRYLQEEIQIPSFDKQYSIVTQLDIIGNTIERRIAYTNLLTQLIRSVYFEILGNPIQNTKNWQLRKLSSIGKWSTGGTPKTNIEEYYIGNIPWFTSGELGNIFIENSEKKISKGAINKSNAKIIQPYSLLIGLYDTAAFKMSINKVECSCNQAIIYCKPSEDFYTLFLYYTLLFSKEYYLSKRKGARQKNLSSSFIRDIEIIYPTTLDEIERIKKFYSIHDIIYPLINNLNNSLIILKRLSEAVLQNAFKPDVQIDEEPIFKDLIKKLSVANLKGNKQRLTYLLKLFEDNVFDNNDDYMEAKDKLFDLISADEIEQQLLKDKITLRVK